MASAPDVATLRTGYHFNFPEGDYVAGQRYRDTRDLQREVTSGLVLLESLQYLPLEAAGWGRWDRDYLERQLPVMLAELERRQSLLSARQDDRIRRDAAIGADLIPRASPDDDRYAGLDLAARGRDLEALGIARSRLRMAPGDLPAELRQTSERIAGDLQVAGPDDIGRWASDCQYAYADVPNIAEPVQVAMFHA